MTTFVLEGMRNGAKVSVTWADGALGGDEVACAWLRQLATQLDGQLVGPPGGPYTRTAHLSDPYSARALMRSILVDPITQTGDVPARVAPKGAVI